MRYFCNLPVTVHREFIDESDMARLGADITSLTSQVSNHLPIQLVDAQVANNRI
jgi:hypothetical protein